jgi:maleylpyruvate isomerase
VRPDKEFEPAVLLDQITAATGQFSASAAGLTDAGVREPSLLPGWSRGHVLTHLARNADGGSRLLSWARTGAEAAEYPSMAARAEEIEAGAGRSAAELLADVRESADRFAAQYARMPAQAWQNVIRWTGGQEHPAARAADSRLTEVLVHHVDLRTGYTPAQWPGSFTREMLGRAAAALATRGDTPAMRLHVTGGDTWYDIGTGPAPVVIHGSRTALLAWLMGRSPGADLVTAGSAALPTPPFLY